MRKLIGAWMVLGGALAACGGGAGEAGPDSAGGGPGSGAGAGSGTGSEASTGSGSTGIGGGFTTSSTGTSSSGSGGSQSCAGETVKAELAPLDMFVMFDRSGSMDLKTGTGETKWVAAKKAMTAFVQAPSSGGLGLGLEFFPQAKSGPNTCTASSQCGAVGPCVMGVCAPSYNSACASNADCGGKKCEPIGVCSGNPAELCFGNPSFDHCADSGWGKCDPFDYSFCAESETSCSASTYASPAVAIAPLPGVAPAVVSALDAERPSGGTPTRVALQGALDHAKTWAAANPTHKVVVLLATDGLPTECLTNDGQNTAQAVNDVAAVASSGLSGSPSVPTFVIGVFSQEENQSENAQGNLDKIASAGGTDKAFIVNASGDVTQPFIDALNKIRGNAISCEYQLPPPPEGKELDFKKVNIQYTSEGGQAQTIPYVETEAGCAAAEGGQGWYYDVPPEQGDPTKILVCPKTCELFQSGGEVDIQIGCETQTSVPK